MKFLQYLGFKKDILIYISERCDMATSYLTERLVLLLAVHYLCSV